MDKLVGLIEAYDNRFMECSLFTSLKNINFTSNDRNDGFEEKSNLMLKLQDATAFAEIQSFRKIYRQNQSFKSTLWKPLYPLVNNFDKVFYSQTNHSKFNLMFITSENTSVSNADFVKTLTSCFHQLIPNFGTVLSISEVQLPYSFIHEIYVAIEVKETMVNVAIVGNFYKLGKISSLVFKPSENQELTISLIHSLFKKPILDLNLDQTLWRIGLDSLKIATLEFKIRNVFEAEELLHGFSLKLKSIRQLLEITNNLTMKKVVISDNSIARCDLSSPKLPITEAQKQLLFLCKTENGNNFIEEFSAQFETPIIQSKMKMALKLTLGANISLNSIFGIDHAKILPTEQSLILFDDKEAFENYEFDVFSKPSLIYFVDGRNFGMKFHHILMDGKSLQLFVNQLMEFYYELNGASKNDYHQSCKLNYFDLAVFENKFLASNDFSKSLEYWKTKLSAIENLPKLLKESSIISENESSGKVVVVNFPPSLTEQLQAFCSHHSVSIFSAFIAFYRLFIYKLYGYTGFPIVISIDNRLDEKFQNTIGLFVNLAIVSFILNPNENFETLLKNTSIDLSETISNGIVSYNKVVSALRQHFSIQPEMPEVMLVQDQEATFEGFEVSSPKKKKFIQNHQIWYLKEVGNKMKLLIEFRDALFSEEIMQNQAERFLLLIFKVLSNPSMHLKNFDLLTSKEENQFMEFRQRLSHPLPVISPIELIMNQLNKCPNKVILKSATEQLKSEAFLKKVLVYAEKLKTIFEDTFDKNIPFADQSVALLLQRSVDLITLVLACWYLNFAPLMIAVDWPYDRISASLKGFKDLLLITDDKEIIENHSNSFEFEVKVVPVSSFHNFKPSYNSTFVSPIPSNPTDLAYLTFTSGSTGVPKAVQSQQRGLINLCQNYSHYFSIDSGSRIYQVVNPAFDIFFADIILSLGNGGSLFLVSQKIPKMEELKQCTHAYIMPAYLSQLDLNDSEVLKILKNLKGILYGGEPININFLSRALNEELNLFQQFGVTEHSIYSNFISPKCDNDRLIVGQNFDNFHGYLVDGDGCRLPPINLGVQGWFRSAGIAVARGYIGLNVEKENLAFGCENWFDGWRYFDSGDRMKIIQPDKDNPWNCKFIFCGRSDTQIKIRGNRVELRDVEEPFRSHSNIKEVVCLFNKQKLMAFIYFKNGFVMTEKDLQLLVQEKLPTYMIPDDFIILDSFPLNSNGKIDRQKLLSLMTNYDVSKNIDSEKIDDKKKADDLMNICCDIFAKHLKVSILYPEEDLFKKGADSLKLLIAVQEIEEITGININLAAIFRERSLSKVVKTLNKNVPVNNKIIHNHPHNVSSSSEDRIHPLSYSQEHLWFLAKLNQETQNLSYAYILRFQILLHNPLLKSKWMKLIKFLITKHPILRTQIIESNGIPSQRILPVNEDLIYQSFSTSTLFINILNEPPAKFKLSPDLKTLEISCHHIAIDGFSLSILINDIKSFLASKNPLEAIPDYSYFNFIKEQKSYNFTKELEYFNQKLTPVKDFVAPTDYTRSQCSCFKAGHYQTTFDILGFDECLRKYQISEIHFVLAIFALSQFNDTMLTSTKIIPVGVPFANRTSGYNSTVGYFVNVHAIPISRPNSNDSFFDYFSRVKDTVIEIISYSHVPFELVVRRLKPKREINKSPTFQQMIIFEDLRDAETFNNFKVNELETDEAKLDQTWRVKRVENNKLEIYVEFMEALFNKETIVKTVENFKALTTKALQFQSGAIVDLIIEESVEKVIKNLWKEILELNEIAMGANFFEEGGHSLLAARLTSMVNNKYQIKASINLLFEHQTLEEYTKAIEDLVKDHKDVSLKLPFASDNAKIQKPASFRIPVNPLQIPLLQTIRKAAETGNASIIEAYINQIHIQCPDHFEIKILRKSLEKLIQRHSVLRTKFGYARKDESNVIKYYQEILNPDACKNSILLLLKPTTLDIFQTPAFRVYLDKDYVLTLEVSHLISDGHSMNILAKDLFAIFNEQPLPQLKIDYTNFNQIFSNFSKSKEKRQINFWISLFSKTNPSLIENDFIETNFDYSSITLTKIFFNGNSNLAASIKTYNCNPISVLIHSFAFRFREKLCDFNATLKIAFCKDMRPSEEYYDCIGFFINTLIIPIEINDTIQDVEKKVKGAQENSWISMDELQKIITKSEDEKLFDVMMVIDNAPVNVANKDFNGFKIIERPQTSTKFDLTIFVQMYGKDLNVKAEYRKSLWNRETIESLLKFWEKDGFQEKKPKITKVPPNFDMPIENLVTVHFDKRDISLILMEAFDKYNQNVAFKTDNDEITYAHLKLRLLQISEFIKEAYFKTTGCLFGSDTIIPVISRNSINQWLICLAIIFAGGAYLPIDDETPEVRVIKILDQLPPTLIISDEAIHGYFTLPLIQILAFKTTDDFSSLSFRPNSKPRNLAYIIFTSGTTGIPKGVCINRLGLSNLIADAQNFFEFDSSSVIYQFTNFCFDNSVLEVFAALGSGATCFIPDEKNYFTADKFCRQISTVGITHAMLFPGVVETFDDNELAQLKQLKYWICGAEKLSKNLFKKAMKFAINVNQNYGPTETTAYVLRKKLKPNDDPQNLGTAIQNAKVTIRRPDGWLAMIGSKHELFIASVGLTRGYLGRKWDAQPFVTFGDGFKHYPSGDICQLLPSGDIRFVGRKDNQVKIRGFRIELDEIESCLISYSSIKTVKVMLNAKKEDIIAYYSARNKIEIKLLKDFLKSKLPYYMIPRFFIYLETFPLTSNTKINTKKLMEYETRKSKVKTTKKVAAINTEEEIKQIWKNVLKLNENDFDVDDSFFYLGGNSLTVQRLVYELKNELKININMEEFYNNPTINYILKAASNFTFTSFTTKLEAPALPEKIPLSYQQEQMLYLEQIDAESSYNLVFIQEFDKTLVIEKLKKAFYKLLEENAIFRTIVKESNDDLELYQEVLPMEKCFIDIKVEPFNGTEEQKAELKKFKHIKFDLFNEIPLRIKLLENADRFVILLVVNHAASDATTTMLMEKELSRLYQGLENNYNKKAISYQDYSLQQKSKQSKEKIEKLCEEYFLNYGNTYLNQHASLMNLFDVKNLTQRCSTFKFHLSSIKSNFTPFTLITAAVAKAFMPLFPYDRSLLIGCPYANRTIHTTETFGNFLNNLILPLTSKYLTISLDKLQMELFQLLKYGEIPFQTLCKHFRQKSSLKIVDIQVYLNCRYDLENESGLKFDEIESIKGNPPLLKDVFEEVANYPIEIDLDEVQPTSKATEKSFEVTVRISKSLMEADEAKIKEICKNFEIEANKFFRGESRISNDSNKSKMLAIFNKFLQSDLKIEDLQKSFIDLGGDSILAMKLRRAVMKEIGVELDLKSLLTAKSLQEILASPKIDREDKIIEFYKSSNEKPGVLIIFVYPLVGGCLVYSSLIKKIKKLDSSNCKVQSIVGLYPPFLLPKTLEKLASHHKSQLTQTIPNVSKIIFIGASFGAALGYQLCHEFAMLFPTKEFQLISIDGTLQTSLESLPTFEAHRKQITDIVSSFSADIEVNYFNLENEINSSWSLLQMATRYIPKSIMKPLKCILLHAKESANLENLWNKYVSDLTVIKINGTHETMLSPENSSDVAKIILSHC